MKNSKELLSSLLKTTQMGQIGIRSVLNAQVSTHLRKALQSQTLEYDSIEQQAHKIASDYNWQVKELDPAIKAMTNMMTRARLSFGNVDSKVAAMMIQGNTKGLIKGLKNLHQYNHSDPQIEKLSEKLLKTEQSNIEQMQGFV